jgi:hypothetical protein
MNIAGILRQFPLIIETIINNYCTTPGMLQCPIYTSPHVRNARQRDVRLRYLQALKQALVGCDDGEGIARRRLSLLSNRIGNTN